MKHMMIKVLSVVMALTMIMGMFGAVAVSAAGHTHTKGKTVKTVAPTCVAYGYTLYECADCGEQYADDVLPKAEECQNIKDVAAVDATCTKNAITAGKQCQDCGKYVEGGEEVKDSALGHDQKIGIKQPTCDKDGMIYVTCGRCTNKDGSDIVISIVEVLPATGDEDEYGNLVHTYEYVIIKHPTCSEAGVASYRCVNCDEYTYDNIYVAPSTDLHDWIVYEKAATCLTAGFYGRECKECYAIEFGTEDTGFTKEGEMIPATKHMNGDTKLWRELASTDAYAIENNITEFYKAETCTEDGFQWRYCKSCKAVWKEVLEHPEDHRWATKSVLTDTYDHDNNPDTAEVAYTANDFEYKVVAATCEKAGYIVVGCLDCTATKNVDNKSAAPCLSKNGQHSWATGTKYDKDNGLWVVVEPTCLTAGYTAVKCYNKGCTEIKRINAKGALGCELIYVCDACGAEACTNCTHTGRKLICANANEFDAVTGKWVIKAAYKDTTDATKVDTDKCDHVNKAATKAHEMTTGTKTIKVPATCTEYAYDAHYCTNDGCEYIKEVKYYDVDDADNDGDTTEEIIKYKSEGFDATNHSGLKEITSYRVNPTCKTAGSARYLCQNCSTNEYVIVTLPVLEDHENYWEERDEIAATCLNTGKTAGIFCTHPECGGVWVNDEYVSGGRYVEGGATIARDLTNHDVSTAIEGITRVATCTVPTITFYTCPGNDKCSGGEFFVKGELDPYNHNTIVYDNNGTIVKDTRVDGEVTTDSEGNPVHHGAGVKSVAFKAPNCLEAGTHAHKTCEFCGDIWDVVDDGCYICEDADAIMKNPASSEKDGDWFSAHKTYVADADGTPYKYDEEITRVIPALGHTWTAVNAIPETCTTVGYTAGHNCTTKWDGVSVGCTEKKSQFVIAPHGDKYQTEYAYVAPTCTTVGWGVNGAKFTDCSKCREAKVDLSARKGYIAPLGHKYVEDTVWLGAKADCENVGFKAYKCEVCANEKAAWVDANSDGVVDVYTDAINLKFSEYTWFVSDYVAPHGHVWETNANNEVKTFDGYLVNGEIVTGISQELKCISDAVKFKKCTECDEKVVVGEVVAAKGHFFKEKSGKEKALPVDCLNIKNSIGLTCTECGTKIDETKVTHNIVAVHKEGYCTNDGPSASIDYYACTDCNVALFNATNYKSVLDFTPTVDEAKDYYTYDSSLDDTSTTNVDEAAVEAVRRMNLLLSKLSTPHTPKFDKVDSFVPATIVADGSMTYTCAVCGKTVTVVIPADADVLFTAEVADVNGSKVTANGNEIVVSIAYSAKAYAFRALELYFYYNSALTFNKAEVKATFDEKLAVTTDVEANNGYINILTMVNVPKAEATLAGSEVAYVDLYFTVNDYDDELIEDNTGLMVSALVYNDEGVLVNDINSFDIDLKKDIESAITGDADDDGYIYTTDLVAVMDLIYTADADYVATADINKDGKVDIDDYAALRTFLASMMTSDDYAIMLGETVEEVDYAALILDVLRVQKIDINDDGIINGLDFKYLVNAVDSGNSYELNQLYNGEYTESWYGYFWNFTYDAETITMMVLDVYEDYLNSFVTNP